MNYLIKKNIQINIINFSFFLGLTIFLLYFISIINAEILFIEYVYIENLINYEGGFVRRGLLGHIIYKINFLTNLNPINIIYFIYAFAYSVYIFLLFIILSKLSKYNKYLLLLIIISPATVFFPLFDFHALFRKEVFFFIIFFYHVYIAQRTISQNQSIELYKKQNYLIIFPILILNIFIHEFQFFLIFFHIFVNLFVINFNKNKKFYLNYSVFIIIFIFFVFPASYETINQINNSLEKFLPGISDRYTPVTILTGNINLQLGQTLSLIKNSNLNQYLQLILVFTLSLGLYSFIFLSLLKKNKLFFKYNKILFLFFNICSISLLFLFMILSFDMGRLFHIILMHLIGFYLIFPSKNFKINELHQYDKIKYSFTIILYFILFYLPHGNILGGQSTVFDKMNTGIMIYLK